MERQMPRPRERASPASLVERALCPDLVGRRAEMSLLEDAFLRAVWREGRLTVLTGDAGMGKTRLADAVAERSVRLGGTVLWGSCSEADLSLPYLPFLEAIGNRLASTPLTDLRSRLGADGRYIGRLFPQLGDEDPVPNASVADMRIRLYSAVLSLLSALATDGPMLLVVEDVHWADPATRELLDYLARRARSLPLLILATLRTGEIARDHPVRALLHGWRRSHLVDTLELVPLTEPEVGEMMSSIFDDSAVGAELRGHLYRRCLGNPFVLEEMLKEALDRGSIFRSEAGWTRLPVDELRIPETVRDAILTRIERLPAEHRELLCCAAVMGDSFEPAQVAVVADVDDERATDVLDECAQQQLVSEEQDGSGRYRFRHSLTWEVVYTSIPAARRRRLHQRVADMLVARGAVDGEVSRHLIAGGRVEDAMPLLLSAAQDAMFRHAYLDAADLYERTVPHLHEPALLGGTLYSLGEACYYAGSPHVPPAITHLVASVEQFEACGLRQEAARVRLLLGRCYWERGQADAGRREYQCARDVLEQYGPSETLAMAYVRLSELDGMDGRFVEAEALARRGGEVAVAADADEPRLFSSAWVAVAISESGRVDEALAMLTQSYSEATERNLVMVASNSLNSAIVLRMDLLMASDCSVLIDRVKALPMGRHRERVDFYEGWTRMCLGDLPGACASLRRFRGSVSPGEVEDRRASFHLARALAEAGQVEEANVHLIRPDPEADWQSSMEEAMYWARCHLLAGSWEEAVPIITGLLDRYGGLPPGRVHLVPELADTVVSVLVKAGSSEALLKVTAEIEDRGLTWAPWGTRAMGRIAVADRRVDQAVDLFADAATRFAAAGYRPAEAETRALHAVALYQLGRREEGVAELRLARDIAHAAGAVPLAAAMSARLRDWGVTSDPVVQPSPSPNDTPGPPGQKQATVGLVALAWEAPPTDLAHASGRTGTPVQEWREWALGEIARQGLLGSSDHENVTALTATSDLPAACVNAVRTAVILRDKANLHNVAVNVRVAMTREGSDDRTPSGRAPRRPQANAAAEPLAHQGGVGAIWIDMDVAPLVRAWLESRGLRADPGNGHRGEAEIVRSSIRQGPLHRFEVDEGPRSVAGVLTPRELEVAHLVADGLTNAEIGARLHISTRTAATHVGNILNKLTLRSRTQIARWAAEQLNQPG